MAFSIPANDLDPLVARAGELVGLLQPTGNQLDVNGDWFTNPGPELKKAFSSERHDALKGLLEELLGSTNAQTLGIPDANAEAAWYPIKDASGNPTGVYLTVATQGSALIFGVGFRWQESPTDLELAAWVHAPLLKVTQDDVDFIMGSGGSESHPIDIAFEVTRQSGTFGTSELGFRGLRLGAHITFTDVPDFSFIFLDLQLPDGQPASDRSLLELTNIGAGEWVNMLVSLLAAQLNNLAGGDPDVQAVLDHLLPLLGFSNDLPSFNWEDVATPGKNILLDWLKELAASQTYLQAWLEHLAALLDGSPVTVEGNGTRSDPYRGCVDLGAGIQLCLTLARARSAAGVDILYPGILLQAPSIDVGGGVRLALESMLELLSITLSTSPQVEGITAFDARMRLSRNGGPLVSKDFTGESEPLNHLGTLSVGELRAGMKLNTSRQPEPLLALYDVTYLRGAYPVLDLSSSDKMLDVVEQAAGDVVDTVVADLVQALTDALGAGSGSHAGRHLGALLGLVAPPTFGGGTWPVDLVTTNVSQFLGNPLRAIGCYHVACLEAGQWGVMLQELAALLRHASVPTPTLSGAGTQADPWQVELFNESGNRAVLAAWHETPGGRNLLRVGVAFDPQRIDFGGGVTLDARLNLSVLDVDLPPVATCNTASATMSAVWLPGLAVEGTLTGAPHLTTGELAGLELRATAVRLGVTWTQAGGLDWLAWVNGLQALVSGGGTLSLPNIDFDASFDLGSLGDLFRLLLGRWLIERGGFSGFGLAGLLGLLPDLPSIDLPDLPDWSTGPFALPVDWPQFNVPDWSAFFSDPWPAIKLHFANLLQNPDWAFPALRWLGATFSGLLPDLTLPDLGFDLGGGGGLSYPNIDLQITGDGTYPSPWAVSLYSGDAGQIELLLWLDPDGPSAGGLVNAALSWLPPELRDLASLAGGDITNEQWVMLLRAISAIDAELRDALAGVLDSDLIDALDTLTSYLTSSDGVVLIDSQQPDEPGATGWNAPQDPATLPEAHHGAQLSHPDILSDIQAHLGTLPATAPVLLIGAPWEERDVWQPLLTQLGSSLAAAEHFDMRQPGTDPEQVSVNTVTGTGRFYTADLSVFNLAPDVAPADRLLPVNAPGTASSQARQVSRMVDRIRTLYPGETVIIIAHSTAGLAARAAVSTDGDAARIRSLVTVGTPHRLDPLPWMADTNAVKLLNLIKRMAGNALPNPIYQGALDQLTQFLDNTIDWPQFPTHAFVPDGDFSLPTGVSGLMLATRLPTLSTLRGLLLDWLKQRATTLQSAISSRDAVTHLGFGLRLTPPVPAGDVRVETVARVDVARVQIVDGSVDTSDYPPVPALSLDATVTRPGGWLVGGVGENPRLRWMQLGAKFTLDGVTPDVRLYDGYLAGVALVRGELESLTGGAFSAPAAMSRLLNAAFAELTEGALPVPAFQQWAELLQYFGLTQPTPDGGLTVALDAWNALLANPTTYLQGELSDLAAGVSPELPAMIARLQSVLRIDPANPLSGLFDLLASQTGTSAAARALRDLLARLTGHTGHLLGLVPLALDVLRGDVSALTSKIDAFINVESLRATALQQLRTTLGLNDASLPRISETVFNVLRFTATSTGQVEVCLANPLPISDELTLDVCLTVDLQQPSVRLRLLLRPTRFQMALAATYERRIAGDVSRWLIELDWSHPDLPSPYAPLALYPAAPDLLTRVGEMVPRFILSTFVASFVERELLAVNAEATQLFSTLGLASRQTPTAPWKLRPLDTLFLKPREWLTSTLAVGAVGQNFDPARVVNLLRSTARLAGVMPADTIQLPYGMTIALTTSGSQINVNLNGSVGLPGGGTLSPTFALMLNQDLQVGAGGTLGLNVPLPAEAGWDALVISGGYTDDQFSLSLGNSTTTVPLVPFNGFDSALFSLAGDAAFQLLPVLLEATVDAIGDDAASFATELVNTVNALGLNSVSALQSLADDPVVWLRGRFVDGTVANQAATAIASLLSGVPALSSSGGKLSVAISPQVTLSAGFEGAPARVGMWLDITDLETGPLTHDLSAYLTVPTTGGITLDFGIALDMAVKPDVIAPAGVSIEPKLHFSQNGSTAFYIYPLGDAPGSPDFRLDILPSFNFFCESGGSPAAIEDCLLAMVRNILVPVVGEIFLDSTPVRNWLNTPLFGAASTKPGEILISAGLLEGTAPAFDLRPINDIISDFSDGEVLLARLFGAALEALDGQTLFTIPIPGGSTDGSLSIVSTGTPKLYGLNLAIPEIQISDDPEIDIYLGDGEVVEWINGASSGTPNAKGGIALYLVEVNGPNFAFEPRIDLVDIGLTISGKNDAPLFDVSGFRLDGISARMYLSLRDLMTSPQVKFGGYLELTEIGIPLGSFAGDNPVASNLLSSGNGGGGENAPVNPSFSLSVAYVDNLDIDLKGGSGNEVWLPIQQSFGPVNIQQIGLRWEDASETLTILVDGGVSLEGLSVQLDDLSLSYSFKTGSISFGLRGLGIGYNGGGVKIAGALVQQGSGDSVQYIGLCLVEAAGKTFAAMGAYTQIKLPGGGKEPSMFVFVVLPITIGGPPYFFILGISGGFGYNRDLIVPPVGEIPEFPLIAAASGSGYLTEQPLKVVDDIASNIPPARGSYWLAVGLRFQSFALVDSVAMAYILLNHGLEIGLLGVSRMELPPGAPLAVIEMALKVRFSTADGLFSVEAQLTDNSWLLSRDCRLTGGFAFYLWFGGPNQGDFVITLGGYHPRFSKPAHFPEVPRLGFNWRVSSAIVIKGETYFALTTSAVMAGGLLEASYSSGALKAWFKVWADFLIEWKPFRYDIEIGISIGASATIKVNLLFGTIKKTFKVELGARLRIWGPEFTGEAEVTWWVISFTVKIGGSASKDDENLIEWSEFKAEFLPEVIYKGDVASGLLEDEDDSTWKLNPEFVLSTETAFAANSVQIGSNLRLADLLGTLGAEQEDIDIRPTGEVDIISDFILDIVRSGATVISSLVSGDTRYDDDTFKDESGGDYRLVKSLVYLSDRGEKLTFEIVRGNLPAAMWDRDSTASESTKAEAKKVPGITGIRVVVDIDEQRLRDQFATGQIPVGLVEVGDVEHPLPFGVEISVRPGLGFDVGIFTDRLDLLPQSQGLLGATRVILASPQWQQRRVQTISQLQTLGANLDLNGTPQIANAQISRRRAAPPVIASLYEGLAAEPNEETELMPFTPQFKTPILVRRRLPKLQAVLRQRPEPTRSQALSTRTTVFQIDGQQSLGRVGISSMPRLDVATASLKRVSHPKAARPTQTGQRETVFTRDRSASAAHLEQFQAMQARALIPMQRGNINRLRLAADPGLHRLTNLADFNAEATRAPGVQVQAGTSQVWTIPASNATGAMPEVAFTGDQGLRITALNKADAVLLDVEVYGTGRMPLPPRTARVAVTGLGRPVGVDENLIPAMGALTLVQSTQPVAVVGWQRGTQLMQITRHALLGRGAVLRLGAPLPTRRNTRAVNRALLNGAQATAGQVALETTLPARVSTIGIMVEVGGSTGGDITETLAVGVEGALVSASPLVALGESMAVLLYAVRDVRDPRGGLRVSVANKLDWQVVGVIGLTGSAAYWQNALATQPLDTLVENGPLSPAGRSRVAFLVDAAPVRDDLPSIEDFDDEDGQ